MSPEPARLSDHRFPVVRMDQPGVNGDLAVATCVSVRKSDTTQRETGH